MSPDTANTSRAQGVVHALLSSFAIFLQYPVLIPLGLITLFAQMTYSGINNVTLLKYIPTLGASEQVVGQVVGSVISIFLFAEMLARVPFGWLSDRFGRGRLIIGALLLTVPTLFASGRVPAYGWLYPLRWWDGMMAAALWPSLFALIGDTVPQRHRANAMGFINMMYMLALFCGFTLAGTLYTRTGDPRLYFTIGALLLGTGGLIALTFFRFFPKTQETHSEVTQEEEAAAVVSVARHTMLLVITFLQHFAITLLAPYMFGYLTDPVAVGGLGFTLRELAVIVGAPVLGVGLLALPLSRVGDMLGKLTVVRLAFTVIGITLWLFSFNRTLPGLAVTATIIAVAFSMAVPAWMALLSSLGGTKTRGVTLAGYGTVQGMAAVLGPIVAGVIWDRIGHAQIFWASAVAVTIAAVLAWVALPERRPRSPKRAMAV